MITLEGGCHCGNLRFSLETGLDPASMEPRACGCRFCRKHDTRALSDPAGRLQVVVADEAQLGRYRFGTGFTDFLICRRCGVYIGAFMPDGEASHGYANIMANSLDDRSLIGLPARPVQRTREDADTKRQRRRDQWTPAILTIAN